MRISIEEAKRWSQFIGQDMEFSDHEDFSASGIGRLIGISSTEYSFQKDGGRWFDYMREPQPKLKSVDDFDWSEAPEWATAIAVDSNGDLYAYEGTVSIAQVIFKCHRRFKQVGIGYDASDWENSKRLRPVEKVKFERIEDTFFHLPAKKLAKAINDIQEYLEKNQ